MSEAHYVQIGVAMTCRSFEEYVRMFDLTEHDLEAGPILDVAGGGSSFTAEARSKGYDSYAADPRYNGERAAWVREAKGEIEVSTAKLSALTEKFNWSYYGSLERHRAGREKSLKLFADHACEVDSGSIYKDGSLPNLPYPDNRFSLIVCSHFLFLYAEQFGLDFHIAAVEELMRITKQGGQIRIYPLLSLNWKPYSGLRKLEEIIASRGGRMELCESRLPFIPESTHYMKIIV